VLGAQAARGKGFDETPREVFVNEETRHLADFSDFFP
jgi:hypothetical protein